MHDLERMKDKVDFGGFESESKRILQSNLSHVVAILPTRNLYIKFDKEGMYIYENKKKCKRNTKV